MNLPYLGVQLGPILVLIFGLCVLVGLFAIWAARRRARTTGFGLVREQALYRSRRWMLGTGFLALLGGASAWLWAVAVHNPQVLPTPVPTATSTLIPSPTPRPPTSTPTVIPTSTPTPTAVPMMTATAADVELPAALSRSRSIDAAAPGDNALLLEVTLASGEVDNRPVNPTTVFARGTRRVYAFMFFDGMADKVPWSHVWYGEVDGQMREIWGRTELWSYEYSRGRVWRYFDCSVGNFELHVYVGDRLQQRIPFVVQGG